uniref:Metallo-beta-lactamase domain-containing protein n=1 Tax=Anopheles epiroticus TaxID=199890 RepID=A0A182P8N3_9DIPT
MPSLAQSHLCRSADTLSIIVGTHRLTESILSFRVAPYPLTDDIEIQATPGHTLSCVTVLVARSNLSDRAPVAIVGDLFERQQDIDDERLWLDAGSEDPRAQRTHRARIANLADWIVPGHGGPFRVDATVREKLNQQQQQQAGGTV